jgi:hypothetical protein
MVRTIFDHIINKISILVDNQIDEVQERQVPIKASQECHLVRTILIADT